MILFAVLFIAAIVGLVVAAWTLAVYASRSWSPSKPGGWPTHPVPA
jgi:hypothetical protein